MSQESLGRLLTEADAVRRSGGDVVDVAVFVEDALGIVLPEEALTAAALGTPAALARTLAALGER